MEIDRSFVNDVTASPNDAAIIAAIASLARTLKLEGVDTAEQARRLAEQGCRMMQGFLFSNAEFRSRVFQTPCPDDTIALVA